jgi:peptidoglycan/LPS O-acetylase OafA/YrhL
VFRPDVEGLRALAIVLVLLCHAGVGAFAGGYVGVDVFFVISGFVITRMLVAELDATGRISLARFYARRVKRLMPQALSVIAAVVVAAGLLLSPLLADAVAGDVPAAGAYAMNWRLSAAAVDYFAVASDGPLDHFWSLAVEEQFYVAWPLLLVVLSVRRRAGAHGRLIVAVAAIAAASFAFALREVRVAPESAYFSPAGRGWELALGGLVALGLAGRALPPRVAAAAAWSGVAAIALAATRFGPATAVPGLPALLPTAGAAALIGAGASRARSAPIRSLSTRPAGYVGRISYALYIWHWPVLVFAGPRTAAAGVAVVLASALPAIVTHRWIEEPLRRSRFHVRRPRLTLGAAIACPVFAVGCSIALSSTIASPHALTADEVEGAAQLARTHAIQTSASGLRPTPREADADRGRSYEDGCLVLERAMTSPPCVYGDRRSATTVVLFGDSHAMQFFPALDRVARSRHWRLVQLTKSGCPPPPVRVVYALSGRDYRECRVWREYALRRIERQERPALVVAASSAHYDVIDGSGRRTGRDAGARALAGAYGGVLRRLRGVAPHVAVISDTPRPPLDVPSCVSQSMHDLRRCAFAPHAALARARIVSAAIARVPGISVIDPAGRLCLARLCPAVIGDVLVYRNSGHLTASFVETLDRWLARRLPRLTARAAASGPAATGAPRAGARRRPARATPRRRGTRPAP